METKHKKTLYTIGYEGRTLGEFITCLKTSNISIVIDVREIPVSRKKGFSKSRLKLRLESEGLGYIHIRDLGSPKALRKKLYKDKDYKSFFRTFNSYLDSKRDILEDVCNQIFNSNCCLLCYERHAEKCHRSVVAKRIAEHDGKGLSVVNI